MPPKLVRAATEHRDRSAERETLAAAITRHAAATKRLAAIRTAQETAIDRSIELNAAVAATKEAVDVAKSATARHLVDRALGEASHVPQSVRSARNALQDLEDERDAHAEARAALEKQAEELTRHIEMTGLAVSNGIRTVVRTSPELRKLLDDYLASCRRTVDLRRKLDYLDSNDFVAKQDQFWRGERDWLDLPGDAPWRQTISTLAIDPDVALPSAD
jgi:hypothetical protein